MIGDRLSGKVLNTKLITDVEDIMLEAYELPDGWVDIGVFTTELDGIGYAAAVDATKKANIDVMQITPSYGFSGQAGNGEVFGVISGPTVSDVENGLRYVRDFTERHSELYSIADDDSAALFAQCIPKIGRYFSQAYGLKPGSSIAYLLAPVHLGVIGVDEALTQANCEVICYQSMPGPSNMTGAILTGTESACRTACTAFRGAVLDTAADPLEF